MGVSVHLTIARTVWGEARGEPWIGMVAVAWVIRNRAARPSWWGRDYETVCRAPRQFSCWDDTPAIFDQTPRSMPIPYAAACAVALGDEPDPTDGATHYHSIRRPSWARQWPPSWAASQTATSLTETARIGGHVFYR